MGDVRPSKELPCEIEHVIIYNGWTRTFTDIPCFSVFIRCKIGQQLFDEDAVDRLVMTTLQRCGVIIEQ